MQVKRLFNIYGFKGGSFAGNVYDTDGIAPSIKTCEGGNSMPLIAVKEKEIILKQYPHGYNTGFEYKDIAPTLTTSNWEHNNFIIEIE